MVLLEGRLLMVMSYQPRFPQLRECIGIYGDNGVGKSTVAISMMRRMTDRHFHVFDNNNSYEFSIYEDDEKNAKVIAAQNFTIYPADFTDWLEQKARILEIEAAAEPGDWAVFDMVNLAWDAVPSWYTTHFLKMDEMEYRAAVRQALEEKRSGQQSKGEKGDRTAPLFDQLRDWQHINPEYKRTMYGAWERLNQAGVHVLAVTDFKLVGDKDDKALRKRYGGIGARPGGQKAMTGCVQTMLYLQSDGEDEFTITTAKDRGSRKAKALDEEPWEDFCSVYLTPVARWSMQKVD